MNLDDIFQILIQELNNMSAQQHSPTKPKAWRITATRNQTDHVAAWRRFVDDALSTAAVLAHDGWTEIKLDKLEVPPHIAVALGLPR